MKHTVIVIFILLAACSQIPLPDAEEDPVVATAYGQKFYLSELNRLVPKNVTGEDSVVLTNTLINKWVQQQVLVHNAKENLTQEEQDFSRQMEEYKNSLLLYRYERKLIGMSLDTLVGEDEIELYYLANREHFELRGNIVKFDYVKLPARSKHIKDFRRMMKPGNLSDSLVLTDYCQKYSTDYWLADTWVFLQDLLENIPLHPDNEENFLRRTQYTEKEEGDFVYMLRINDFKTTDSIPPLAFEKENIRNIIINSRKLALIEKLRQRDIDKAFRNKDAVIYNQPAIQ